MEKWGLLVYGQIPIPIAKSVPLIVQLTVIAWLMVVLSTGDILELHGSD